MGRRREKQGSSHRWSLDPSSLCSILCSTSCPTAELRCLVIDWIWTTPSPGVGKWQRSLPGQSKSHLSKAVPGGQQQPLSRRTEAPAGASQRSHPQHPLGHMTTGALWPLAGPPSKTVTSSSKSRHRRSELARWLAHMIQNNKQGCTVGCAEQLNIRDRRTQLLSEESPRDSPSPSFPAHRGHLLSTAICYSKTDIYREKENL